MIPPATTIRHDARLGHDANLARFCREWAMPSPSTFGIPPIAAFLARHLDGRSIIIDPFARDSRLGTHRNDLSIATCAEHHLPADDFARLMCAQGIVADAVLFDPPYSPRQIKECYESVGLPVGKRDTQHAGLIARTKDALAPCVRIGGIAICCGWNSAGFGVGRGFRLLEVLIVCHGGSHNDTIVTVEEKLAGSEVAP